MASEHANRDPACRTGGRESPKGAPFTPMRQIETNDGTTTTSIGPSPVSWQVRMNNGAAVEGIATQAHVRRRDASFNMCLS
jgi:hypothetical protein